MSIIIDAQTQLAAAGIRARTVSCPSLEIFARQSGGIPHAACSRAGSHASPSKPRTRCRGTSGSGTDGTVIGLEHFGASAPFQKIYQEFGLTAAHVIEAVRALVAKRSNASNAGKTLARGFLPVLRRFA